ncbi:MAG: hypothetical protein H3C62_11345, partial [Gemmatimonadaceae bacterium]|nr:hypothetical protein [Gemmatimonadaceae bacterium]
MRDNALPSIPWQVTGNHWVALPCVHPVDGSVHALGVLHRGARAAVEFAGSADFQSGQGAALARPVFRVDGTPLELARGGIAWERAFHWLPTFTAQADGLIVRGTIFAPFGLDADIAGVVYALAVENRGSVSRQVSLSFEGVLGHRQVRVRSARPVEDASRVTAAEGGVVVLDGSGAPGLAALAIGSDEAGTVAVHDGAEPGYVLERQFTVEPG